MPSPAREGVAAGAIITCATGCRLAEVTQDIELGDIDWVQRKTSPLTDSDMLGRLACPECGSPLVPPDGVCYVETTDDGEERRTKADR